MGIYVCADCQKEHQLIATHATAVAPCEICGPLKNDWTPKSVIFTWEIIRVETIKRQLEERLNAEATVRFAIGCALADTAHLTHLHVDGPIKEIEDALIEKLFSSSLGWATLKLLELKQRGH